jgi:hypothetical protein
VTARGRTIAGGAVYGTLASFVVAFCGIRFRFTSRTCASVRFLNDRRDLVGSASSITGSDRRLAPDRNAYDRPETQECVLESEDTGRPQIRSTGVPPGPEVPSTAAPGSAVWSLPRDNPNPSSRRDQIGRSGVELAPRCRFQCLWQGSGHRNGVGSLGSGTCTERPLSGMGVATGHPDSRRKRHLTGYSVLNRENGYDERADLNARL